MIKSAAIAASFALMAASGFAYANAQGESTPGPITSADQCVWNYFNDTAANFKDLPGEYTREYAIEELLSIASDCEKGTGTDAKFFKGVKSFETTVGNVTLTFG